VAQPPMNGSCGLVSCPKGQGGIELVGIADEGAALGESLLEIPNQEVQRIEAATSPAREPCSSPRPPSSESWFVCSVALLQRLDSRGRSDLHRLSARSPLPGVAVLRKDLK